MTNAKACSSCHLSEFDIAFGGHLVFEGVGVCAEACSCFPQHVTRAEHDADVRRWSRRRGFTASQQPSP